MADILLPSLSHLSERKINGESKRRLLKLLQGELSFLVKAAGLDAAVLCSNLNHLQAVASLLEIPDISNVVSVLHTFSFQRSPVDNAPSISSPTAGAVLLAERATAAVDLVCLLKGEPTWVVVSARNPRFLRWESSQDGAIRSGLTAFPPEDSGVSPAESSGVQESLKLGLEQPERCLESCEASPLKGLADARAERPRATHDTGLKDRVTALLEAANGVNRALQPSKIVLVFARGLPPALRNRLATTFGAVTCVEIEPLAFEIRVSPGGRKKFEPLDGPVSDTPLTGRTREMAPEAEALAWSLVEPLPNPAPNAVRDSNQSTMEEDNPVKGWIVVKGRSKPGVKDAVCVVDEQKCGPPAGDTCTDPGVADASDAPKEMGLDSSFVAVEELCDTATETRSASFSAVGISVPLGEAAAPECNGSSLSERTGNQKLGGEDLNGGIGAKLESEWVAVRPVTKPSKGGTTCASNGQFLATSEAKTLGEDKEWVAVPSVSPSGIPLQARQPTENETPGDIHREGSGSPWVGLSRPGESTEASEAVLGEWIGIRRPVTGSETAGPAERKDKVADGSRNESKGAERSGTERNGMEGSGTERNGIERNGKERNGADGCRENPAAEAGLDADWLRLNRVQKAGMSRNGTERSGKGPNGMDRKASHRNGTEGNGTPFRADERPSTGTCSSGSTETLGTVDDTCTDTPGRADSPPAETRFRTANQVPLTTRPGSWPAGLELVNLDTTALVAFVSGMTNGDAEALRSMGESEFRERWKGNAGFMRDQIEAEVQYPQLPYLESVTAGKGVLVTQYVLQEFVSIVSVVGGESERARAELLLKGCWLIADDPSDRLQSLPATRTIRPRHVTIFGTADAWGCPTLTSNAAFARAVRKVGVPLWILEHRPSALVGN